MKEEQEKHKKQREAFVSRIEDRKLIDSYISHWLVFTEGWDAVVDLIFAEGERLIKLTGAYSVDSIAKRYVYLLKDILGEEEKADELYQVYVEWWG